MVVDRSGLHRVGKLASTLAHYDGQLPLHMLPAHCGHHLNPIAGFWRAMKDAIAPAVVAGFASALPANTPATYGTPRATDLCVQLVTHSASYFAGFACDRPWKGCHTVRRPSDAAIRPLWDPLPHCNAARERVRITTLYGCAGRRTPPGPIRPG
jgi:hypothetical protein